MERHYERAEPYGIAAHRAASLIQAVDLVKNYGIWLMLWQQGHGSRTNNASPCARPERGLGPQCDGRMTMQALADKIGISIAAPESYPG